MSEFCDVLIVGSGPAGLAAAIYTARANFKTIVFEKESLGGQPSNTELFENYPGFEEGIAGAELAANMIGQATNQGVQLEFAEVQGITLNQDKTITVLTNAGEYLCRAILNAGGAKPKKLGVPGEEDLAGQGVIYCAFCDGSSFYGKEIVVAGGGDSAITEALLLSRIAEKITLIELMPDLLACQILQERAFAESKISIRCGLQIVAIHGDDQVKAIKLRDIKTGETEILDAEGILVSIGRQPNTDYLGDAVPLDKGDQIIVNEYMETEIPGVYAAGDIRSKSPRQVSTACGDGTNAALAIIRYLQSN